MMYNTYQPMYQQPYNQQSYNQQMMPNQSYAQGQSPLMNPSSGITWVQGEIGARAYPVGAGNSVMLMDSDDKYFYIKSADSMGMPTLRKYFYSEVVDEPPRIEQSHDNDYDTAKLASREEVKALQEEIDRLKQTIETLQSMPNNEQNNSNQQRGRK